MPSFNFEFNEGFFTKAIERAGGCRFSATFEVQDGVRNADYLIDGYALELKSLEKEPIEHPSSQEAYQKLLTEAFRERPQDFVKVPGSDQTNISGPSMNRVWKYLFGKSIRRGMAEASEQIVATRTLTGKELRGAILVANLTRMIDGYSLLGLLHQYQAEFPEIKVCFGFNAVLKKIVGHPENHRALTFGSTASSTIERDDSLHKKLSAAISGEIASRGHLPTALEPSGIVLASEEEKIELPDGKGGKLVVRPQPARMDITDQTGPLP